VSSVIRILVGASDKAARSSREAAHVVTRPVARSADAPEKQ